MALPHQLSVADYVLEEEALYVWPPVESDSGEAQAPTDLSTLVEDGLVQVVRFAHPEEHALFVDLAALIDDGEAVTGALALCRGYSIATDDRKARRVLTERTPRVRLVSTMELMKGWAEASSVSDVELRSAMSAIQSGASYAPGQHDPLYEWWREIMHDQLP